MTAVRKGLVVLMLAAVVVALFGATTLNVSLYAAAGIVGGLSGIAWGLVVAVADSTEGDR